MSYLVLARKWRPRIFTEVIGQDHVVRALSNALDQNRIHHAYLFSGTRGVGKTTIARIFAKSLNCEKGVSASPCGECAACLEIDGGRFIDLIEVDAASRTGVDDTRELMDNVSYMPSRGRYKVYLIDEVHMFSKSSFNALLKTLEEPPPHVKFLLATTDPQQLLPTVLSRCLQFNLKRVSVDALSTHISRILSAESMQAEAPAVARIARAADGSVRDSLSLLDQAIAFSKGKIELSHVDAMLGGVSHERVYALLEAVVAGDAKAVFSLLRELDDYSPDYYSLLSDLLALLHQIAVCQAVPDAIRDSVAEPNRVQLFAHSMAAEDIQLYYQIALMGRRDMPHSPDERDALEMTLLRMIAFHPHNSESRMDSGADRETDRSPPALQAAPVPGVMSTAHNEVPEAKSAAAVVDRELAPPRVRADVDETAVELVKVSVAKSPALAADQRDSPNDQSDLKSIENWRPDDWSDISDRLGLKGMYAQLITHCSLRSTEEDKIDLILTDTHRHLHTEKLISRVEQSLRDLTGRPVDLKVSIGVPLTETAAQRIEREQFELQQQAEQAISDDPIVQDIKLRFDASIATDSIEPVRD
jgi:DNA polymerase-3 subunit gamma/tau